MYCREIGINEIVFVSKMHHLMAAIDGLTMSKPRLDGYDSRSEVIAKFCDLYHELVVIVAIYKALLERDASTFSSMGRSIIELDKELVRRWQ
jgi:hypothetical protein